MAEFLRALCPYASRAVCFSDAETTIDASEIRPRVVGLAAALHDRPRTLGLLGANGTDWAIAQLAAWIAGKIVVPLPAFFSRLQLDHVIRDAGVEHVVATRAAAELAASLGLGVTPASAVGDAASRQLKLQPREEGGMIVYTSGSTARPKGVRLGLSQIDWQARALAEAIGANAQDRYLSVLPLSLLLETIAAICIPVLVGAQTHFASGVAEGVGIGRPSGLAKAFADSAPTASVLVPQLLAIWVAELEARGERAPSSLRFVAVGGAPLAGSLAERALALGVPVHEGYGLTECCSVVAVNRPGRRRAGTVGEPLRGLKVTTENGEIVVRGPTVMEGYLHGNSPQREWRTGDLGTMADGYLTIAGRKDNMMVTASGRNVSPEWVEAMVTADPRVAGCLAIGHGLDQVTVLIVPSPLGEAWFGTAPRAHVLLWLEQICADAPAYAVPKDFAVCQIAKAKQIGLLMSDGRIKREAAHCLYPTLRRRAGMIAA